MQEVSIGRVINCTPRPWKPFPMTSNGFPIRTIIPLLPPIMKAEEILSEALRVVREGGVILYPTDTVWGSILAFFLTPALAVAICLGLLFLLQKLLPRTAAVLTGGRKTAYR